MVAIGLDLFVTKLLFKFMFIIHNYFVPLQNKKRGYANNCRY